MTPKKLISVSLFAAIICILSIITIPLQPVPITLQVFAILITGSILGKKLAPLSVIVYIILGSAGLPVFAGGEAGFGILMGPKGGYLIGFAAAAFIIGFIVDLKYNQLNTKREKIILLSCAMLAGIAAIYAFGVIQLSAVLNLSLKKAIMAGMLPFIPFDIAKAAAAVIIAYPVKERLSELQLP